MEKHADVSIRASLQQRGEHRRPVRYAVQQVGFNPRLTSAARRTGTGYGYGGNRWRVSIRASLQQRGERVEPAESAERNSFNPRLTSAARRTDGAGRALFGRLFQSAPHFSSEANVRVAQIIEFAMLFQSAPHFSSEANAKNFSPRPTLAVVSIRASLQQRGERPVLTRHRSRRTVSIRASLQQRGEPCRRLYPRRA